MGCHASEVIPGKDVRGNLRETRRGGCPPPDFAGTDSQRGVGMRGSRSAYGSSDPISASPQSRLSPHGLGLRTRRKKRTAPLPHRADHESYQSRQSSVAPASRGFSAGQGASMNSFTVVYETAKPPRPTTLLFGMPIRLLPDRKRT